MKQDLKILLRIILREPKQCQINEHRFRTSCINRDFETSKNCPLCLEELSQTSDRQYFTTSSYHKFCIVLYCFVLRILVVLISESPPFPLIICLFWRIEETKPTLSQRTQNKIFTSRLQNTITIDTILGTGTEHLDIYLSQALNGIGTVLFRGQ